MLESLLMQIHINPYMETDLKLTFILNEIDRIEQIHIIWLKYA